MTQETDAYARHQTPANAWNLRLNHEICTDVQAGLDREWLVTNGLGGYAAGTILGATTRSYHGLLVAALRPPVVRTVLIAKIDEEVILPNDQTCKLGVNEYQDGIIDPQGYTYLDSFWLEGDIPCFLYRISGTLSLEKRIWMEYGYNRTYVQYTLKSTIVDIDDNSCENVANPTTAAVTLKLFPFCLSRDYHSSTQGSHNWYFLVENQGNRCRIQAFEGAPAYQLIADPSVTFTPVGLWYWHVKHRREEERGLLAQEDVYLPGIFSTQIVPNRPKTLVLSAEPNMSTDFGESDHQDAIRALVCHERRVKYVLSAADHGRDDLQLRDPVHARLVVAADQFIVASPDLSTGPSTSSPPFPLSSERKTIIAGYPWFTDWGRDSMIALPGLLLCTGRYSEARGLLKSFASFMHHGLIPNHFPDDGEAPVYNTVDAALWMFHALDCYFKTTNDWALLEELFPVLSDAIQWHVRGTEFNIHVDPNDGLLYAGMPGVQLTWMDAKVDDQVITPRRGKPVEVNALWYYALTAMESWAVRLVTDATPYSQLRSQIRQHFAARFWYGKGGYLYDVVDVDGVAGQNDASLRPNQLFAASLTHDLLLDMQVDSILQQVTAHLLTPAGLRSLSPADPHYHNHFRGDRWQRDSAYHQGTVWQWLIGSYVDVHLRLYHDRTKLLPLLEPLIEQLWNGCLGTISEIAEPELPFTPEGCFAQAWSVAELLRCWLLVARPRPIGDVGGV